MREGLTNIDIGARLGISPSTVKHHVSDIGMRAGMRAGIRDWPRHRSRIAILNFFYGQPVMNQEKMESLSLTRQFIATATCQGLSVKEIAASLQNSQQNVKNHLRKIYDTLGAFNKVELWNMLRVEAEPAESLGA